MEQIFSLYSRFYFEFKFTLRGFPNALLLIINVLKDAPYPMAFVSYVSLQEKLVVLTLTAFPITLVSHAIILLTDRLYLVYTKTFHYPPRTRHLYQSRGLPRDCWKPHNPIVGKHLGELPIHSAKMLDLIYGMICLAFTRLFRTCFVIRQDLKAK